MCILYTFGNKSTSLSGSAHFNVSLMICYINSMNVRNINLFRVTILLKMYWKFIQLPKLINLWWKGELSYTVMFISPYRPWWKTMPCTYWQSGVTRQRLASTRSWTQEMIGISIQTEYISFNIPDTLNPI